MRKVNKLTGRRKGQVTIFIIAGMLIVVIVFFLFYAVKISSVRQLEAETRRVSSSAVSSAPIQHLGNDCVKKSLREGIVLLGKQGGWFFEGQPGHIGGPGELDGVSYALYQETYPDSWPCAETFNAPDYCRYVIPEPEFFSHLTFPSMSQIKRQLGEYIKEEIPDCIDVDELIGLAAHYEATTGDINVKEIKFGAGSIYAQVDYPIEIAVKGGSPIIHVQHLEATVEPIRFEQIYSAVRDAVEKEKRDLTYYITEELPTALSDYGLSNAKWSYDLKKGKGIIFKITDSSSRIDGVSDYLFQFAIKNRPPVLDYISKNPSPNNDDFYEYDYLATEGEKIDIKPVAIDPDDEEIGDILIMPVEADKLIWVKVFDANNKTLFDSQIVRISYGR